MKQFSNYDLVEAFVSMKIHFIENEEDYFGISIDTKAVKLPYFEILIPNSDKSSRSWYYLLLMVIIGVVLYFGYNRILAKKNRYKNHERVPTRRGNMELSKITTDPDH